MQPSRYESSRCPAAFVPALRPQALALAGANASPRVRRRFARAHFLFERVLLNARPLNQRLVSRLYTVPHTITAHCVLVLHVFRVVYTNNINKYHSHCCTTHKQRAHSQINQLALFGHPDVRMIRSCTLPHACDYFKTGTRLLYTFVCIVSRYKWTGQTTFVDGSLHVASKSAF